jgi:hypothetical protein
MTHSPLNAIIEFRRRRCGGWDSRATSVLRSHEYKRNGAYEDDEESSVKNTHIYPYDFEGAPDFIAGDL